MHAYQHDASANCLSGQYQASQKKEKKKKKGQHGANTAIGGYFLFFFLVEESLHAHRCQSYQQPERQIKQTTGELRVHSTSYDKGSCFAMA